MPERGGVKVISNFVPGTMSAGRMDAHPRLVARCSDDFTV
jgi:hypothetical protein